MSEIIDLGFIPASFLNYQNPFLVTFDIETLNRDVNIRQTEFLTIESLLYVVSIAVSSNIPGTSDKFFCRKTSSASDGHQMVAEFMDYLEDLHQKQMELIPIEITTAMEKLNQSWQKLSSGVQEARSYTRKDKLSQQIHFFKKFLLLNIYGFNSGKSNTKRHI